MNLKSRKNGISLISLIITIIVIIILAAIVIFSGMNTPEKAQLSKVISDIDNVQTAVDQAYYGLYTEKAVAGEVWTKSQFYEAVATGKTNREDLKATGLVEIAEDSLIKINLPKYEGRKWYIAVSDVSDTVKTGSAVLSPGFESAGKVYATLLDVQSGGSDGAGLNGENDGEQEALTEEEKQLLSELKIGDFVNYMGTNVLSGEDMSTIESLKEVSAYNISTRSAKPIYWRVIDKNEETGEVMITMDGPYWLDYSMYNSAEECCIDMLNNAVTKIDKACADYFTATGAKSVRSMKIEDMNKLCRRYSITGENAEYSIENLPLDDLDALAQLYGVEYVRYAYYHHNTPNELVKDVEVEKNGNIVIYHGVKLDDEAFFLTYDDENGNTYKATRLEESETFGDGGYRVPILEYATEKSRKAQEVARSEPVLVSMDAYCYVIPDEVLEIINDSFSRALTSVAVIPDSDGVCYNGYLARNGVYPGIAIMNSARASSSSYSSFSPVVTLSFKHLEKGKAVEYYGEGEYCSWKIK